MSSEHLLDRIDRMLIAALQQDADMTAERLSETIALSPSAITRRVRRLRDDGWLGGVVAMPGRALIDTRLHSLVRVQVEVHAEERGISALRERLIATPEVQMLLDLAGEYDLAVLICARDMANFNTLASRLFESDPSIRRYETTIVKRVRKHALAVPVSTELR